MARLTGVLGWLVIYLFEHIDLNNVGVSSKVEKADLSSVKERLAMLKRKKENPQNEEYSE